VSRVWWEASLEEWEVVTMVTSKPLAALDSQHIRA
jgi:putative SOS response-associated peptidase YedK